MTVALLDANVLYPATLRDLLLWLAAGGVYSPRWTDAIHEEWTRSVLEDRPDLTRASLERTRTLMDAIDSAALVTGYEARIAALNLPDEDDRHVLAAAIESGAEEIVTFNLSDFPDNALAPCGVRATHPDAFLCALLESDSAKFLAAAARHRASLRRPPKAADEYVGALRAQGLARLAARLEGRKESL